MISNVSNRHPEYLSDHCTQERNLATKNFLKQFKGNQFAADCQLNRNIWLPDFWQEQFFHSNVVKSNFPVFFVPKL